jgi:lipopolysaccharide heptosyltransferase I
MIAGCFRERPRLRLGVSWPTHRACPGIRAVLRCWRLSAPDLRAAKFSRILLIKPSALGDVVHTIPALVKLRACYPEARIDWMLTPENAELVRCHPALSSVVIFARRELARTGRSWKATAAFFRLVRTLRSAHYDLAIDLHGQLRSGFFALATGAGVRIGFDRPVRERSAAVPKHALQNATRRGWAGAREGSWLAYTHRIPIPTLDVHAVDRYLWLGAMLGLDDARPDFTMHLPSESEKNIERLLAEHRASTPDESFALLVPGTIWETKHWTPEGFAGAARGLMRDGFCVLLAGTPRDRERCEKIAMLAPGTINLCGKTSSPAELAALIQRASICLTNDSGAMHLAAALGRPVISVFGPTNPARVGPYNSPDSVVRLELSCSPCNFRRLSQCPFDHACMRDLSAETVLDRIRKILPRQQTVS